jgi:ABC-type nitrate/sulfonate/bicarbonate transport system substrate-binding protein
MAIQRRWGLALLIALCVTAGAYAAASRLGYLEPLRNRFFPRARASIRLSAGDFPAGVSAPVGDIASIPLRPARVGFIPRGCSVALLLATGGVRSSALDAKEHFFEGLLKSGYAMDAKAVVFGREEELRQALAAGAESGGVDIAALSVDRLAQWADSLRDAAPRTVLMLGRSRGQDGLAGVGVERLADLRAKRLGAYFQGSDYYFALWALSRGGLSLQDVKWVSLSSSLEAGAALREGRADAVAGLTGDVELAARDRGGKVLATTADAPHLIATVLVTRGEFAARYPDAIRRMIRAILDGASNVARDPNEGARLLGEVAPYLGDPLEAIRSDPPATLRDNLAFFGLSGEAPVTYDELLQSSGALLLKIGRVKSIPVPEDTRDVGALRYVSEMRKP